MNQIIKDLPGWRSILFVPAHVERFVLAAHTRGADAIVLDLEDSVPFEAKDEARKLIQSGVSHLKDNNVDVLVRVNQDLKACVLDLEAVVIPGVSAITLPKTLGADHIRLVDAAIADLERSRGLDEGGIGIIALVETVAALESVESMVQSSPRLSGVFIGSEDLSYDGGFQPTTENLFGPCQRIVLAARQAKIRAYGFPGSIAEYRDKALFTSMINKGKSMGFDGAFCIHPSQVPLVNDAYEISESQYKQAEKIITAYEQAVAKRLGAVEVDGKMIDLPVVDRAREIVAAYKLQH